MLWDMLYHTTPQPKNTLRNIVLEQNELHQHLKSSPNGACDADFLTKASMESTSAIFTRSSSLKNNARNVPAHFFTQPPLNRLVEARLSRSDEVLLWLRDGWWSSNPSTSSANCMGCRVCRPFILVVLLSPVRACMRREERQAGGHIDGPCFEVPWWRVF